MLLGTLTLVKEPDTGSLMAAALALQAAGVVPSDPEFAGALFAKLTPSVQSFFAVIQVCASSNHYICRHYHHAASHECSVWHAGAYHERC